jgi:replicative DNA helicase
MSDALPRDLDAERAVIGSLLLDPSKLDDVGPILRPDDFHLAAHGQLYAHLADALGRDAKADPLLIAKQVGGDVTTAYIAELVGSVPVADHAAYYAGLVARKAAYRRLILAGHEIQRLARNEHEEPEAVVDAAEKLLRDAWRGRDDRAPISASEALAALTAEIDGAREHATGSLTGLPTYDRHMGGLFPGELVVIAARPALGKTALGCQIAHHFASRGRPVYFVSLEMTARQLMLRVLCSQADVSSKLVRIGAITSQQADRLVDVSQHLAKLPIHIHDAPDMTVGEIRRTARRLHRQGLALVVVDYLQRITPRDGKLNRDQQVGEMSTALKGLALELELPVLCLVQLNRDAEKDSRPRLGHLRESGSIEADADVVAFLQRGAPEKEDPREPIDVKLHVLKNRSGETGVVPLRWVPATTRFMDEEVWV